MEPTKEIQAISAISGASRLSPERIRAFLNHFDNSPIANNSRYELIYAWASQKVIDCKQMKILIRNIKVRRIEDWVKNNGDNLFSTDNSKYTEDFIEY